jgi:hypothetical protein
MSSGSPILRSPMPPVVNSRQGWTFRHLSNAVPLILSGNRMSEVHVFKRARSQTLPSSEPRYGVTPVLHLNAMVVGPVAFQYFTTSPVVIPLYAGNPKCRTPIPRDPLTRILVMNGSNLIGKSRIAIS